MKEKGEVGDCFKKKGEADDGANVMLSKMLNASENYPYGLLNGIENPLYCYFLFWLVKLSVARDPVFAKYLPGGFEVCRHYCAGMVPNGVENQYY